MKCLNCGYDNNNEDAHFCQGCGTALKSNLNTWAEQIILLLKDDLFMILCILYSVSTAFSLINLGVFTIIGILMTIFLWMLFAQGRKGIIDSKYMHYISGTIFAAYIVKWIQCVISVLYGVMLVIFSFSIQSGKFWGIFDDMFDIDIMPYMDDYFEGLNLITNFYLLLASAAIIVSAIIGMIFNGFGRRAIHRLAQSVYKSLEGGKIYLFRCEAAQNWLMAYGILNAIYAVVSLPRGDVAAFLNGGCWSAAVIIGSILVRKYFADVNLYTAKKEQMLQSEES